MVLIFICLVDFCFKTHDSTTLVNSTPLDQGFWGLLWWTSFTALVDIFLFPFKFTFFGWTSIWTVVFFWRGKASDGGILLQA